MNKQAMKYITLFVTCALVYMGIEMLWRGRTHWSMGILGGIVLIIVGLLDEFFDKELPLLIQAALSSLIITVLEYYTGVIVNIKLQLNVWDYSQLPFNVDGQVCLYFSLLWSILGVVAVFLDNFIRHKFFGEKWPKIRWI